VELVLALKRSETARIAELFPLEEFYCPPKEIIVQEVGVLSRRWFRRTLRDIEAMLRVSGELIRADVLQRWMWCASLRTPGRCTR
jgi:hypothetical protein